MLVNRQCRKKQPTSTVRAGSLILAPTEGGLEASQAACIAPHNETGQVVQVFVDIQGVQQFDSLEHLANLFG